MLFSPPENQKRLGVGWGGGVWEERELFRLFCPFCNLQQNEYKKSEKKKKVCALSEHFRGLRSGPQLALNRKQQTAGTWSTMWPFTPTESKGWISELLQSGSVGVMHEFGNEDIFSLLQNKRPVFSQSLPQLGLYLQYNQVETTAAPHKHWEHIYCNHKPAGTTSQLPRWMITEDFTSEKPKYSTIYNTAHHHATAHIQLILLKVSCCICFACRYTGRKDQLVRKKLVPSFRFRTGTGTWLKLKCFLIKMCQHPLLPTSPPTHKVWLFKSCILHMVSAPTLSIATYSLLSMSFQVETCVTSHCSHKTVVLFMPIGRIYSDLTIT